MVHDNLVFIYCLYCDSIASAYHCCSQESHLINNVQSFIVFVTIFPWINYSEIICCYGWSLAFSRFVYLENFMASGQMVKKYDGHTIQLIDLVWEPLHRMFAAYTNSIYICSLTSKMSSLKF